MSRLALVALLLLCGCLRPVEPPAPEPDVPPVPVVADGTISAVSATYDVLFRRTCLDAARNLRKDASGRRKWGTDRQYRDGHAQLVKDAVEAAGQPFADRQQREATPFDPDRMADWLERVAAEGQQ